MGLGKTYSTKYLLDSNNNRGAVGQVLSTTSTGIDWVNANTVPGAGLWLVSGNNIYNSNSGNVGIGTTGPDAKLEIVQDTGLGSSGKPTLIVANDPNGATGYTFQSWRYVESNTNFRLDLKQRVLSGIVKYSFNMVNNGTGFDNVLVLDRGNVGIGTDSPTEKLHLQSTTAGCFIRFADDTADGVYVGSRANVLELYAGNAERMRINSQGQMWLGGSFTGADIANGNTAYLNNLNAGAYSILHRNASDAYVHFNTYF